LLLYSNLLANEIQYVGLETCEETCESVWVTNAVSLQVK